ncbi:GntR family transcriptional regulator [Pantoea ananatis]|uniref:GntR family transcriptional regulator n=1 Tax=Pantoea ananas TaxID=553 RepID=UPI001FF6894E|nr:GntR family transcriptional regulator [Pantoea ananatis]MCK0551868.1 GntR family transcriptional regulator [Pantoea ananatis]
MNLTPLQSRILREIVSYVRREQLPHGTHVVESQLARELDSSRSPVKTALKYLTQQGMFIYDKNRGYFLAQNASELGHMAEHLSATSEDPIYQKIAELRLTRQLPELFTEIELMRELDVSRAVLRNVLTRIQQEGWLEFRAGQGWKTLPAIDSIEAYQESYALRIMIEPAGLMSDAFNIDRERLEECRRQHQYIAEGGFMTMTPLELFEANSDFHEMLASCSGNRFLLQTVKRLNQLRRLVEYRQAQKKRQQRKSHSVEHIEIIDLLLSGDRLAAANKLRLHLERAKFNKVQSDIFSGQVTEFPLSTTA